eukprot:GHVL01039206.1.p1 GENE.GHVL01039206.1~~GHVL01039206.1.p1  ORF type:complete len:433 (-),score=51.81 GHVL01039206.1:248-1546(-)
MLSLPSPIHHFICRFFCARELARIGEVATSLLEVSEDHVGWQDLVLKSFGYKYENFMLYNSDSNLTWKRLYAKLSAFVENIRESRPVTTVYPRLLSPSNGSYYEGAVAMSADCKLLLWENGSTIQAADLETGKMLFERDIPGRGARTGRPCIVNTRDKIFLYVHEKIQVWDIATGRVIKELTPPQDALDYHRQIPRPHEFALDISIRNQQIAFLMPQALCIWGASDLELKYVLIHDMNNPLNGDLDFLWAGYELIPYDEPHANHFGGWEALERMQGPLIRRSRHVVTWQKSNTTGSIHIHDIDSGKVLSRLHGHKACVMRVRQCPHVDRNAEYYLASLDKLGCIKLWDSATDFTNIAQLESGLEIERPFRLCLTSTALITVYDNARGAQSADNRVDMSIYINIILKFIYIYNRYICDYGNSTPLDIKKILMF